MALNSKNIPGGFVTAKNDTLDAQEGRSLLTQNEPGVYSMSVSFVDTSHMGVLRSTPARGLRAGELCNCNCQISVKVGWVILDWLNHLCISPGKQRMMRSCRTRIRTYTN